ncbi:hypothetical protein BDQ12DRAFT_403293 [Crucibulum laeve]|uniref:Fungal-type protein kinase domain-containing protein n=1 Tax=Crucibulum laeve TaxID=68775 RepID=A0A5C3LYC2_9AGAR|nr:hypothetical protein BDQ12DRAFT_403293 [Crucibulum laeve]
MYTRIIMKTWGFPLSHFRNVKELLTNIRGGIEDHRNLSEVGILHGDISAGNILICPSSKDGQLNMRTTTGRLIDFDCSKITTTFAANTLNEVDEAYTSAVQNFFSVVESHAVEDAVIRRASEKFFSYADSACSYIKAAIEYFDVCVEDNGKAASSVFTVLDLNWHRSYPVKKPQFPPQDIYKPDRAGTLPYMSAEVLNAQVTRTFKGSPDVRPDHASDVAHDIESFFWVLLYFCLTW